MLYVYDATNGSCFCDLSGYCTLELSAFFGFQSTVELELDIGRTSGSQSQYYVDHPSDHRKAEMKQGFAILCRFFSGQTFMWQSYLPILHLPLQLVFRSRQACQDATGIRDMAIQASMLCNSL